MSFERVVSSGGIVTPRSGRLAGPLGFGVPPTAPPVLPGICVRPLFGDFLHPKRLNERIEDRAISQQKCARFMVIWGCFVHLLRPVWLRTTTQIVGDIL